MPLADFAILFRLFGFIAPKTFNYLAFQSFNFERTFFRGGGTSPPPPSGSATVIVHLCLVYSNSMYDGHVIHPSHLITSHDLYWRHNAKMREISFTFSHSFGFWEKYIWNFKQSRKHNWPISMACERRFSRYNGPGPAETRSLRGMWISEGPVALPIDS